MSIIKTSARVRRRLQQAQSAWRKQVQRWMRTSPISIGARIRRTDLRKPAAAVVVFLGAALLTQPWWSTPQNMSVSQPTQQLAGTPLRTDTISPAPAPAAMPLPPPVMDMAANERLRERILRLLAEERLRTGFNAWREADVLSAVVDEQGAPLRLVSNRPEAWQQLYEAAQPARMLAAWLLAEADVPCGARPADTNTPDDAMPACSLDGVAAWLARIPPERIRQVARQEGLHLPPGRQPHEALLRGEGRMTPHDAARLALRLAELLTAGRMDIAGNMEAASLPRDETGLAVPSNGDVIPAVLSERQRAVLWALLLDAVETARRHQPAGRTVMLAAPARNAENRPYGFVVLIARRDGRPLPAATVKVAERVMFEMKSALEEASLQ